MLFEIFRELDNKWDILDYIKDNNIHVQARLMPINIFVIKLKVNMGLR